MDERRQRSDVPAHVDEAPASTGPEQARSAPRRAVERAAPGKEAWTAGGDVFTPSSRSGPSTSSSRPTGKICVISASPTHDLGPDNDHHEARSALPRC